MLPAFITRFRPVGPWRLGPEAGARERVGKILHSDTLYSAVSWAMSQFGSLDEWLSAVFRRPAGPAVLLSSCFPTMDGELFVVPPHGLWPPAASPKIRWKSARFVPISVVQALLAQQLLDEDHWLVDGASECLLPVSKPCGPFRPSVRSAAAVDRITSAAEPHLTACMEFADGGGMWTAAVFADEEVHARWSGPVRAALRLLADSGLGGRRALGWGRSEEPEFTDGVFPDLILPPQPLALPSEDVSEQPANETAYWLLSLLSPSGEDSVDWERGNYSVLLRGGRVESPAGRGALKRPVRMIAEGSMLFSPSPVRGGAPDVAPDGFPHPVYRAGFALTIRVPWRFAS